MIRKAVADDAAQISSIFVNGSLHAYNDLVEADKLALALDLNENKNTYFESIEKNQKRIFVNEDDGVINGFINILIHSNSCELLQIYVSTDMKGKGIGSKLVKFCEEFVVNEHLDEITLWVIDGNQVAINFYKKHGFTTDGTKRYLKKYSIEQVKFTKNLS